MGATRKGINNLVHGGSRLIQDRLSNKKVFIVLDDVHDAHQLNVFAGDCEWFGKRSIIIVTTREIDLLTAWGDCNYIYGVRTLRHDESLDLFCRHAFPSTEIKQ